jgi:UDP-glucose 4-epimerase
MRVLVTGGLGFIGQNLAIHFRKTRPDVTLIAVDWFEGASDAEKSLFDEVHHACFSDPSSLALFETADVIVHLAARTTVQESISDPLLTFENNVVKTQTLLEHLRTSGTDAKFIFASTGGAIIGDYAGAINEEIVPRPLSPYGASKLAVEGLLSAYHGSFGLRYASLRFSNIYGPNSWRKSSVVAAFCKMYLEKGIVQINGDGQQTRDYIFVGDVCDAIFRIIEQDANGVFQLGTGIGTSILDIADIFINLDPDADIKPVYADALAGEVRHNQADISKIRNAVGFEPKYSVADGIRETMDWFKNRG